MSDNVNDSTRVGNSISTQLISLQAAFSLNQRSVKLVVHLCEL